jgi:SAM-dependent methyltransferase
MFPPSLVPPDPIAQLTAAREEADRRYNAALTALDAALAPPAALPHPPPPPDEHQVTPLNERWRLLPDAPDPGSGHWLARKLRAFVWGVVAPLFERQQAFNAVLVDHVNRSVPVDRATRESVEAALRFVDGELRALARFHSALIVYAQQITPFVDTKDHSLGGQARDLFVQYTKAMDGGLAGLSDELLKRWESMVAREQRYDAKVTALTAAHASAYAELRSSVAVLQQASLTLKREMERLGERLAAANFSWPRGFSPGVGETGSREAAAYPGPEAPGLREQDPAPREHAPGLREDAQGARGSSQLEAWKYVGFEDRFRGSQEEIRARLEAYLPYFAGASDVLDIGCGRGEFLDLLREQGITGRGLDLNHEMVEVCRARGLTAVEGDALAYLRSLPDGSLGGLLAAQVVEHLEPDYLLQLLEAAFHALRPGSTIILETINPACWFAFFSSYIRDITHVRPLHPDTLSYLLTASGFQRVDVRYSAPYPERDKLRQVPGDGLVEEAFNANVDKLNSLLFTYLDYAAIGVRL